MVSGLWVCIVEHPPPSLLPRLDFFTSAKLQNVASTTSVQFIVGFFDHVAISMGKTMICMCMLLSPCVSYDLHVYAMISMGILFSMCILWSLWVYCSPCVYYDIHVYTMISMCILWSPCVYTVLHVYTMISMCILWSPCVFYDLYVYTMISLCIQWSRCLYNDLYAFIISSKRKSFNSIFPVGIRTITASFAALTIKPWRLQGLSSLNVR